MNPITNNNSIIEFNDLPEDTLYEILSYIPTELLLGIPRNPNSSTSPLSLVNKRFARVLSENGFWIKKFQIHFDYIFEDMTLEQIRSVSNWRKHFIDTRRAEFDTIQNPEIRKYLARLYSAVKEVDLIEVKQVLSEFESLELKNVYREDAPITQLFISNNKNPALDGSILKLARRSGNQGILNEIYSKIESSIETYCQNYSDVSDLKNEALLYWKVHCWQSPESIIALKSKLSPVRVDRWDFELRWEIIGQNEPLLVHMAAEAGYIELLEYLLKNDISMLNSLCKSFLYQHTPLSYTCQAGETEAALFLIQKGADVMKHSQFSIPPFHYAAGNGMKDVMSQMLAQESQLIDQECDGEHEKGQKALDFAIKKHKDDIALWLIENGAEVSIQTIHSVAQQGRLKILKKMYEMDRPCLEASLNGMTPIYFAAQRGHLDVVEFMLLEGVNCNIGTTGWDNPLMSVVCRGNIPMALLLLSHGAIRNPLPTSNRHRHQFWISNPFTFRGNPNPGFNFPWESKIYVEASQGMILLWDLLKYIDDHNSSDYVEELSVHKLAHIHKLFFTDKQRLSELSAAEKLRDMIYKHGAPDSLDHETRVMISKDYRLRAVLKWYSNDYIAASNLS